MIESAIGGQNITRTIEGRERYPVNVRYERGLPAGHCRISSASWSRRRWARRIPLAQLAAITLTTGPAMIRDEGGQLAGYVYVDTVDARHRRLCRCGEARRRAAAQAAGRLHAAVDRPVRVPGARARAAEDPAARSCFFVIFMLLYMTFHSASEATIVMLSVVYAMTGGVILQWLLGYNFSVAVWVGYIALYGVAVQTGVVMVVYLHEALDRRLAQGGEHHRDGYSRGHDRRIGAAACGRS